MSLDRDDHEATAILPRTSLSNSNYMSSSSSAGPSRRTSSSSDPSRETRSTDRTKTHSGSTTSRELAHLLAIEKSRTHSLVQSLSEAHAQLSDQRTRIEEAEKNLVEVTSTFMKANKERLDALHRAVVAEQDREVYRIQLLVAQNDIHKAQTVVRSVDALRVSAEQDAAKYKKSARALHEERLVFAAREEGRRMGFKEGLQRARAEVGFMSVDSGEDGSGFVTPTMGSQTDDLYDDDYSEEGENPLPVPSGSGSGSGSGSLPSAPAPAPPPPIPPLPSTTTGQIHPTIIHNLPPPTRHSPVNIPPDGMIPIDSADGGIMLPPPHELSPMPPIMELNSFSPVPEQRRNLDDEPIIIPPRTYHRNTYYHPRDRDRDQNHTYHPRESRAARESSPESNSTAISQFDMLTEPHPNLMAEFSPMSAIPESVSGYNSPNVPVNRGDMGLGRSGSLRTNSTRRERSRSRSPSPTANARSSPSPNPGPVPEGNYIYQEQAVERKPSMASIASSSKSRHTSKPSPSNSNRPYTPPQVGNIYSNPSPNGNPYQQEPILNGAQDYMSMRPGSALGERTPTSGRSQTPMHQNRSRSPSEPPFIPPGVQIDQSPSRKPSRKSSMTSAASSSRTASTRQPGPGIYTTLAPPELQNPNSSSLHSPQSESSGDMDINVSILSPTPPGSTRNSFMTANGNGNNASSGGGGGFGFGGPSSSGSGLVSNGSGAPGEGGGSQTGGPSIVLNEYLSARDAERPMPMPMPRSPSPSPRLRLMNLPPMSGSQAQGMGMGSGFGGGSGSGSPRVHPVGLGQGEAPLPTAPFGMGMGMGTPVALGGGEFFVPSSFTSSPGTGSNGNLNLNASPRSGPSPTPGSNPGNANINIPGSYASHSPGMSSTSAPVIPDPSLLGPADSDSDSDAVSSGMHSLDTLTTPPPSVAAQGRGGGGGGRGGAGRARGGGGAGGGKKKRRN